MSARAREDRRDELAGCRAASYWLSASVLTITSAPSLRHASRPAWKPAARPLLFVSRTMWSTPWARATSMVRSVEPSSMTSHSTSSKPATSRGRSASVTGSVCLLVQAGDLDDQLHGILSAARVYARKPAGPAPARTMPSAIASQGAVAGASLLAAAGRSRVAGRILRLPDVPELRHVLLAALGPRGRCTAICPTSTSTARRPSTRSRSLFGALLSLLGRGGDR